MNGQLLPFKKGAFKFAFEIDLPILPITIKGTDKILPSDSFDLMPGRAEIIIHDPIDIKAYDAGDINLLMRNVRDKIAAGLTT